MHKAYRVSILYFLLFALLLLATASALFAQKIGFTQADVLSYYLGNEALFIGPKSVVGVLKIILPHIFAYALFVMVVLHFLIFTKMRNKRELDFLIYASYVSIAAELFSPFFIMAGLEFFAYVKIAAFFTMSTLQLYISYLLFDSIFKA